ncbi:SKP1-like protein 14 [Salvia divinorum]|uniref:SKP1-like protein n=1 Tax=Salvia divinorum TaxID=28513 RepID=A0ABD1FNA2_SALDI
MAETPASAAALKTVTLVSSDGERFEIAESSAKQSITIGNIIDDGCCDASIPVPNVTGKVLTKVIEYLKNHGGGGGDAEKKEKDDELVSAPVPVLLDYILAANYLDIKGLVDLVAQEIADSMKDKSPEWVRSEFNIENDYTPEEEEAVKSHFAWAF